MDATLEGKVFLNGVNGVTGEYLAAPQDSSQAIMAIPTKKKSLHLLGWMQKLLDSLTKPDLGLPPDIDPADYRQAGWGIVFHEDESPAVKDALLELVKHRQSRVADDQRCKVLVVQKGETERDWRIRYGVDIGNILPTRIPYYLLLVGSPERIPFQWGELLDVEYAVGRLYFDTVEEYARYAASVVEYETSAHLPTAREVAFFGTHHDVATHLSARQLVQPLAYGAPFLPVSNKGVAENQGFKSLVLLAENATKEGLAGLFAPAKGRQPAALLMTASHGIVMPYGHTKQAQLQGALVCQDWMEEGSVSAADYFSAVDVPNESRLPGMITFHFACYSAGTPERSRFSHKSGIKPPMLAKTPFVARLPQKLLAHPAGGALACIGHVERSWGFSIATKKAGTQILPFWNAITRILMGQPVGLAMKEFNEKYLGLTARVADLIELKQSGAIVPDEELLGCWNELNDAKGYAVLGDPVVRLRIEDY
jgi:hypothetical protein